MSLAGYLVHTPWGDIGSRGTGYTYILARNGLFLEAENPLLRARVLLATAEVRGLLPLLPLLELRRGRVPAHLLSLAVGLMAADPDREMYAALVWDGEYRLVVPEQEQGEAHVTYQVPRCIGVGVHSHGGMRAFFSPTDDADDQGFLVSVVVGRLGQPFDRLRTPLLAEARARLCVYGYFVPVRLAEAFAGVPAGLEEEWSTDWTES